MSFYHQSCIMAFIVHTDLVAMGPIHRIQQFCHNGCIALQHSIRYSAGMTNESSLGWVLMFAVPETLISYNANAVL